MKEQINYPLKFKPILKERIWGGQKLVTEFHKHSEQSNIGESWELSCVKDNLSIVQNGYLKGKNLKDLISEFKEQLVGKKVYEKFGEEFPLLIKYIDAKEALSIQLHPHNDLARERHDSFGKTEMWYVMNAEEHAELIVGFKKDSNKDEYIKHLKEKSLLEILNVDKVTKGDVYFIPTGRVHAIGAGVVLAEIQQTSDITYRIYDWDRQDSEGNYRELHTELALDAIDFSAQENYKSNYTEVLNKSSNIVDCEYFTTNVLAIDGSLKINHDKKDSFLIYMCVEGSVAINDTEVNKGETVLIPAALKELHIESEVNSKLLEVYIK